MGSVDNCNYPVFPFSLTVESTARPVVLARILQHHKELELSQDQILRLLAVARRHHDHWLRISVDFANVSAQLDLLEVRPDLRQKRRLLARHARIFQDHEGLLLRAFEESRRILDAAQHRRVLEIHEQQTRDVLRRLLPSLRRALATGFAIAPAKPRRARRTKRRTGSSR